MSVNFKRLRGLVALVLALALVAAACGDDDSGDDDALGTVVVSGDEDIQIRTLQAISGAVESLGTDQNRGSQLAVQDYLAANPDSKVAQFGVDLGTFEDDLCSAEGGTAGAQAIASQEDVIGVIGTTCSGAAVPASQILSEAGMVLISGSNTSPSLTSDLEGNAFEAWQPGYYRTAHNDLFQGRAVAEFAYNELGIRNAAAIHDGDPYTDGLATAFANAFEELGGTITLYTAVNKGDTDMTPVLTDVAASGPELIYFPIFQPEGDFIIQQAQDIAGLEDTIFFAADGLQGVEFLSIPETAGMYFSGPDLRFGDNTGLTGVGYTELVANYEAQFGEAPPQVFHAHTYDATMLLLSAIEAVSTVEGDELRIPRQALRDHLYSVEDFPGVTGSLSCDEFGDCGAQAIAIVLHEDPSDPEATIQNVVFSAAGR
jgi:branched-chain amino acid transport system substrate-binding protein